MTAGGHCQSPIEADGSERALERLTLIAQITNPVVGAVPLRSQVEALLQQVCYAFGADACVVRELHGESLELLAAIGVPTSSLHQRVSANIGIAQKLIEGRRPLSIEHVERESATASLATGARYDSSKFSFLSYAGAPLLVENRVVGLLGIYSTLGARQYTESELNHLQIVANHIAISIVNDRLYSQLIESRSALQNEIEQRELAKIEREQLEAQLLQAQKMEAIGQLAGGVAHDFNNILTAIFGNVELGLDNAIGELGADHSVVKSMAQIRLAANRGATLTRQLLTFGRRDVMQPKPLNLNHVVDGLDEMLRRLITEDVTLTTSTDMNLSLVKADVGHIEQVIVNLVVNATHAMPDGGRLTLHTQNVLLNKSYCNKHPEAQPGPHVLLAVGDSGHGMDAATRKRIFEPFFTTKSIDKGTGLGLATVHGIVKQAGGHITVDSMPGRGATFKIYLPAMEGTLPDRDPTPQPTTLSIDHETVLLCEDDDSIRGLIARSLRAAGHSVITADSAQACLKAAQEHAGSVDLLITDVIMPDMNGRTLSERLRAEQPTLPVLFISGYTADVIADRGVLAEGVEFLQKPFTRSELLTKICNVVGRGQADA